MKRFFVIGIVLVLTAVSAIAQTEDLRYKIERIVKDKPATVGVALRVNGRDTLTVNNVSLPTMSVYKFHLALAVLNHLEKNRLSLSDSLFITKDDLLPDTYSPLCDARPEGNFYMTIAELIRYTVAKSDNNTCDILFRYVGGTHVVADFIRQLGIKDVSIAATEEEMAQSWHNQYLNLSTPLAAIDLLELFECGKVLSDGYTLFLKDVMIETSTGANKIKAPLHDQVVVVHKTGSSFRNVAGLKAADNDLAIVYLPDGRYYTLAVFVSDSYLSDADNARVIADISRVVYEWVMKRKE